MCYCHCHVLSPALGSASESHWNLFGNQGCEDDEAASQGAVNADWVGTVAMDVISVTPTGTGLCAKARSLRLRGREKRARLW